MRLPGLLLAVVLALAAAPGAEAATLTAAPQPAGADAADEFAGPTVTYTAATGERNRLGVGLADGRYVFTDPGATITTATPECTVVDEHTATCARAEPDGRARNVVAELGDEDDTLRVSGDRFAPMVLAAGGPGDDRLTGGPAYDRLSGGSGTDRIDGGDGNDSIVDGDRRARRDVLDGGGDTDTIDYTGRRSAVRVDLRRATAGARGSEDRVTSFERATGGSGDDRLLGTGAQDANILQGGAGDDVLRGRGGEFGDILEGGSGDDRIAGGPTDDLIAPGTGRDRIDCADGRRDQVAEPDGLDHVPSGCETVSYFHEGQDFALKPGPDRVRGDVLTWNVGCLLPQEEGDPVETGCDGTMEVRERGGQRRLLASGTIAGSGPERTWPDSTDLRLTALGRTTLRREPLAVMRIQGRNLPTASWVFRFDRDA